MRTRPSSQIDAVIFYLLESGFSNEPLPNYIYKISFVKGGIKSKSNYPVLTGDHRRDATKITRPYPLRTISQAKATGYRTLVIE